MLVRFRKTAKPAIDPTLVGIPYLNQEALDLLSNCCTSKEYDMWMSLGPNWIQTIDTNLLKASRMPSSFQPIFSDGWAPVIGELELIGLVAPLPSPPVPHSSSSAVGSFDHHMGAQHEATILQPAAGDGQDRQHRSRHRHEGHSGARAARHPSAQATGYSAAMPLEAGDHSPPRVTRAARNGHLNRQHHLPLSRHLSEPAAAGYHEPSAHLYGGASYADPTIAASDAAELTSPYRSSREIYHRPRHQGAPPRPSNRSGSVERRPNLMRNVLPALGGGGGGRPLSHSKSSGNRLSDLHHPSNHHHHQYQAAGPPLPALIDEHRHAMTAHPSDRYAKASMAPPPSRPYTGGNSRKQRHLYESHDEPAAMMFAPAPEDDTSDYFNPDDPDELDMQPRGGAGLHEAMLLDLGPAQMDWFYELQSRGAMIVRVLFSRAANNDKELSVRRGELLEILDDSRKWWRARNIDLQVAHVPHTIVAPMQGYQTLDDLLANNPSHDGAAGEEPPATNFFASQHSSSAASSQHYARNPMMNHQHHHPSDEWIHAGRNPKNAGAFRYF